MASCAGDHSGPFCSCLRAALEIFGELGLSAQKIERLLCLLLRLAQQHSSATRGAEAWLALSLTCLTVSLPRFLRHIELLLVLLLRCSRSLLQLCLSVAAAAWIPCIAEVALEHGWMKATPDLIVTNWRPSHAAEQNALLACLLLSWRLPTVTSAASMKPVSMPHSAAYSRAAVGSSNSRPFAICLTSSRSSCSS